MSTDHQKYSTENQADAIKRYAEERGIEIVRTYADEGKSGLSVDGRDAFKNLIADVSEGRADFEVILVYDVSRWGRFQDTDESAYYEYICKRAGVRVQYCAEQFENDGSPIAAIIKGVKSAMAGEYIRFDTSLMPDITVVVRMDSLNRAPLDYYLFPRIDRLSEKVRLAEDNAFGLDAYRFDDLDLLYDIARPIPICEAA